MKKHSSAKTYVMYLDFDGDPTVHWQYHSFLRVPGGLKPDFGEAYPPPFPMVVREYNVEQAYALVRASVESLSHREDLGIWWIRGESDGPPPLGKELTEYWACMARCWRVQIWLYHEQDDAEKAKAHLDSSGCCNGCEGRHEVRRMTLDEADKLKPFSCSGPHGDFEGSMYW